MSDLCSAVEAVNRLYVLSDDDDWVQANWPKLAGRPKLLVGEFWKELLEAKPEQWQHMLTEFAKSHPAQKRRVA